MKRMWASRSFAATLVAVALAGCSGGASPSPSASSAGASPSAASSGGASAAASPSAAAIDTTPVIVAWESTPDESYVPTLMAIDAMTQQGYNVTSKQLASDAVDVQALASNTVQFTRYSLQGLAQAVEQGVPIKALLTVDRNSVTWVVAKGYEDCSKLNGKPVGIYSPTAGYTIEQNIYFEKNCPGVKPTFVSIPDSLLRAQALAAGQIVASALGLPDALNLQSEYPGKFSYVDFGTAIPALDLDYVIANEDTIQNHPSIAQALVTQQLKATRDILANPSNAQDIVAKYLPSAKDDSVMLKFISDKLFYANGGFGGTGFEGGLKTFKLPGDRSTLTDLTFLNNALAQLGKSSLTQY